MSKCYRQNGRAPHEGCIAERVPSANIMGQMPQHTARTDSWKEFFSTTMMQPMAVIEEPQRSRYRDERTFGINNRKGYTSVVPAFGDWR